ncbi:MAG: tRNA dihydrouridine synthase DusB [Pirellulaceae bacterium]|nr:tRNA dihydrouridine synthase DusB [Pirellulaceae bacterium]
MSIQLPVSNDTSTPAVPVPQPIAAPFYIGRVLIDPPILQAPMAGFTNYAYRQIVREYGGAGLLATEMVHATGMAWKHQHKAEHPDRLWGVPEEARPLAVQIWDNDPEVMASVARRLVGEYGVSIVDINFGCPVKKVTENAKSGSYLLSVPDRMGQIIECVVAASAPTPVTAKIRLGCSPDKINANRIAQVVENAGASALTVHGRTAADMYRGQANWDRIAEIKSYLKRIPLIGNGDLKTPADIVAAFQRYPVDGVMIARASLGRPWLFHQAACAVRGLPVPPDPDLDHQRECLLQHYALILKRFGEPKASILMRKYSCCYAQGMPGAREFRSRVARINDAEEFFEIVERYFPRLSFLSPSEDSGNGSDEGDEESCELD